MNKKIKVIEVLNEMANDESYRPTVKYQEITYTYHWDIGDYTNDFNSEYGIFSGWALNLMLNDEVEILEDNTEEIEEIELIGTNFMDMDKNQLKDEINKNRIFINKLRQEIFELRKDKNND